MKDADFAAITRSQASAMLAPAPAATPFTAAIIGIGRPLQREHERLVVALDRFAEVGPRAARRHRAVAEVLARTEAAAGAGQHQHARAVLGHARERIAHFRVHLPR